MGSTILYRMVKLFTFNVLALSFLFLSGSELFAQTPYQSFIRKIDTQNLGFPTLSGLTFSPESNLFLSVTNQSKSTNTITLINDLGKPLGSINTGTNFTNPLNMTYNSKENKLLYYNSQKFELIAIEVGTDVQSLSSTDAISHSNLQHIGLDNVQGMTFDHETGDIYILEVQAPRIVHISPDSNGKYNVENSDILLSSLKGTTLRGIAYNQFDGHFFVANPSEQKLYELDNQGDILSVRDLSLLGIKETQSMVFAPSGDRTDDQDNNSLYIVDKNLNSGKGGIVELSLIRPEQLDLSDITVQVSSFKVTSLTGKKGTAETTTAAPSTEDPSLDAVSVNTIITSQWSPPSPDPAGVAYYPPTNNLLITDSEVNEIPALFTGANIFESTFSGNVVYTSGTTSYSDEPTGIAYNPANGHIFTTDDDDQRLYEINTGTDGIIGTADDIITSFNTLLFSSGDPEGVAFDSWQGHLFIADGVNSQIYEIDPGNNGVFDGVPPAGDDVLSQFDTQILGLNDPEGVDFNPDNGHLYIVSGNNDIVVETTTTGSPIQVIDILFLNARAPGGIGYAPSSVNPALKSLYIADRGVDNNSDPNENDGKIYEITVDQFIPSFAINDVTVTEGDGGTVNANFTVTLSAISTQTVTVDYSTANNTAIAPGDYNSISPTTLTFPAGTTTRPVTVQINGDTSEEPTESFFVNLSNVTGNAIIGDGQGVGTITNDDGLPSTVTVSFQDGINGYNGTRDTRLYSTSATSNYGSANKLGTDGSPDESSLFSWDITAIPAGSNIQSVDITLDISGRSSDDYKFYRMQRSWVENQANWNQAAAGQNWQVPGADGSSDRGSTILGNLLAPVTGSYTIPLNASGIAMVQSWVNNASSNFGVIFLEYVNASDGLDFSSREASLAANRPKLTITYASSSDPSITLSSPNGSEQWVVGSTQAITWVSSNNTDNIKIEYSTNNGGAWQTIVANTADDGTHPWLIPNTPSNTALVRVSDISGTISDQSNAVFSIVLPPALSFSINDVTVTEGDAGTINANFTVTLSSIGTQTVTVDYSTADNTAIAPGDYNSISPTTLTFPSGTTTRPVTVQINGDTSEEPTESFFVNLGNVTGNAIIGDGQGTGTITNDDGLPSTVTVSFQDGLNGYNGTRDAKILSTESVTNFGLDNKIGIDGNPDEAGFISWDITSIPLGSTVQSIDLTFNVTSKSGPDVYEIYQMNQPWVETEVNWNVYASGQNWEVSGANGTADRGSTVLGTIGAPTTGIYTISLNSAGLTAVQFWVDDPASNHGFIILDYINASDGLDLSSRETSIIAQRPILTITYSGISLTKEIPDLVSVDVVPETIELHSNYPNPFNLETRIDYSLPMDIPVQISIYNIRGQKIHTLVDEVQSAGYKTVTWNGRDDTGNVVSSGIYFIQLLAAENRFVHKMILQK